MKQISQFEAGLNVGDRVRLTADTLAWKAEMTLQGKIGEVVEFRTDGRVSIRLKMADFLRADPSSPLSGFKERPAK